MTGSVPSEPAKDTDMAAKSRSIEPGQTWQRNDPRDGGRQVEVLSVDTAFVWVKAVRRSRVRRENFTAAYTFVSDAPPAA